jgi:A-factor biosynthesis hotdog domain
VHRTRRENVLVGPVARAADGLLRTAVLNPPEGHHFTRDRPRDRGPIELIEAARQATIQLWSQAYRWPVDVRLTLNGLRAEVPVRTSRREPVELRCTADPVSSGTAARQTDYDLVVGDDAADRVGRISIMSQPWTEAQWQDLRSTRPIA